MNYQDIGERRSYKFKIYSLQNYILQYSACEYISASLQIFIISDRKSSI